MANQTASSSNNAASPQHQQPTSSTASNLLSPNVATSSSSARRKSTLSANGFFIDYSCTRRRSSAAVAARQQDQQQQVLRSYLSPVRYGPNQAQRGESFCVGQSSQPGSPQRRSQSRQSRASCSAASGGGGLTPISAHLLAPLHSPQVLAGSRKTSIFDPTGHSIAQALVQQQQRRKSTMVTGGGRRATILQANSTGNLTAGLAGEPSSMLRAARHAARRGTFMKGCTGLTKGELVQQVPVIGCSPTSIRASLAALDETRRYEKLLRRLARHKRRHYKKRQRQFEWMTSLSDGDGGADLLAPAKPGNPKWCAKRKSLSRLIGVKKPLQQEQLGGDRRRSLWSNLLNPRQSIVSHYRRRLSSRPFGLGDSFSTPGGAGCELADEDLADGLSVSSMSFLSSDTRASVASLNGGRASVAALQLAAAAASGRASPMPVADDDLFVDDNTMVDFARSTTPAVQISRAASSGELECDSRATASRADESAAKRRHNGNKSFMKTAMRKLASHLAPIKSPLRAVSVSTALDFKAQQDDQQQQQQTASSLDYWHYYYYLRERSMDAIDDLPIKSAPVDGAAGHLHGSQAAELERRKQLYINHSLARIEILNHSNNGADPVAKLSERLAALESIQSPQDVQEAFAFDMSSDVSLSLSTSSGSSASTSCKSPFDDDGDNSLVGSSGHSHSHLSSNYTQSEQSGDSRSQSFESPNSAGQMHSASFGASSASNCSLSRGACSAESRSGSFSSRSANLQTDANQAASAPQNTLAAAASHSLSIHSMRCYYATPAVVDSSGPGALQRRASSAKRQQQHHHQMPQNNQTTDGQGDEELDDFERLNRCHKGYVAPSSTCQPIVPSTSTSAAPATSRDQSTQLRNSNFRLSFKLPRKSQVTGFGDNSNGARKADKSMSWDMLAAGSYAGHLGQNTEHQRRLYTAGCQSSVWTRSRSFRAPQMAPTGVNRGRTTRHSGSQICSYSTAANAPAGVGAGGGGAGEASQAAFTCPFPGASGSAPSDRRAPSLTFEFSAVNQASPGNDVDNHRHSCVSISSITNQQHQQQQANQQQHQQATMRAPGSGSGRNESTIDDDCCSCHSATMAPTRRLPSTTSQQVHQQQQQQQRNLQGFSSSATAAAINCNYVQPPQSDVCRSPNTMDGGPFSSQVDCSTRARSHTSIVNLDYSTPQSQPQDSTTTNRMMTTGWPASLHQNQPLSPTDPSPKSTLARRRCTSASLRVPRRARATSTSSTGGGLADCLGGGDGGSTAETKDGRRQHTKTISESLLAMASPASCLAGGAGEGGQSKFNFDSNFCATERQKQANWPSSTMTQCDSVASNNNNNRPAISPPSSLASRFELVGSAGGQGGGGGGPGGGPLASGPAGWGQNRQQHSTSSNFQVSHEAELNSRLRACSAGSVNYAAAMSARRARFEAACQLRGQHASQDLNRAAGSSAGVSNQLLVQSGHRFRSHSHSLSRCQSPSNNNSTTTTNNNNTNNDSLPKPQQQQQLVNAAHEKAIELLDRSSFNCTLIGASQSGKRTIVKCFMKLLNEFKLAAIEYRKERILTQLMNCTERLHEQQQLVEQQQHQSQPRSRINSWFAGVGAVNKLLDLPMSARRSRASMSHATMENLAGKSSTTETTPKVHTPALSPTTLNVSDTNISYKITSTDTISQSSDDSTLDNLHLLGDGGDNQVVQQLQVPVPTLATSSNNSQSSSRKTSIRIDETQLQQQQEISNNKMRQPPNNSQATNLMHRDRLKSIQILRRPQLSLRELNRRRFKIRFKTRRELNDKYLTPDDNFSPAIPTGSAANNRQPDIPQTPDCFLIIYSVNDRSSFKFASQLISRVRSAEKTGATPIILVANKIDLERAKEVSSDEGRALARKGRCKFMEISCTVGFNLDNLLVGLRTQLILKHHHDLNSIFSHGRIINKPHRSEFSQNKTPTTSNEKASSDNILKRFYKKYLMDNQGSDYDCDNFSKL